MPEDINIATGLTGICKWIKSLFSYIAIVSGIVYKFHLKFNEI